MLFMISPSINFNRLFQSSALSCHLLELLRLRLRLSSSQILSYKKYVTFSNSKAHWMEKLSEVQCSCFWHGFWKPIDIQTVFHVKHCQTEKQNNLHRCCRYVPSKEIASENHRDAMTTWWSWWPFGLSGDEANCHIAADMQTWLKKQPI